MLVGNGGNHLGFETPKSAVSQEWIDERSWYFHADANLRKLKVLAKIWFLIYGPKCSQSIRLQYFLINYISSKKMMKKPDFFACWYIFLENRSLLKNTVVAMVNFSCRHSVLRTLKLAVMSKKKNEWNKLVFSVLIQIHAS